MYLAMKRWILRWWLRGMIAYLQRMEVACVVDDADCRRDGKSADYWYGKADGINATLKLLGLVDFDGEKPTNTH